MSLLRDLRIEKDFRVIDVAMKAGVNPNQLSNVERQAIPASERMRRRLSAFYNVSESDLFGEDRMAL